VLDGDGEAVGQLARGVTDDASEVEEHPTARDEPGRGLDTGEPVAFAGDDVARAAPVVGRAVVEDVAQTIPLSGGLQRHVDGLAGIGTVSERGRLVIDGEGEGADRDGVGATPTHVQGAGVDAPHKQIGGTDRLPWGRRVTD
jgi:hypothetical protein